MKHLFVTSATLVALTMPLSACAEEPESSSTEVQTSSSIGNLTSSVNADYDYVLDLYKHFHENPELSLMEKETSERYAKELKSLGFDVTENVGDDWVRAKVKKDVGEVMSGVGGYGVVAVLENGDGPTVMLRADICLLYTSPSPRDLSTSRMPSSA